MTQSQSNVKMVYLCNSQKKEPLVLCKVAPCSLICQNGIQFLAEKGPWKDFERS